MSKIALACAAVMLASLFTAGAPADAAGFKRHTPPHTVYHYKAKPKFKALYKANRRVTALWRFQHRFVLKRHDRRIKAYRYVRRHR